MAERFADVVAQIDNVRQLDSVVGAMRGIAAARAQTGRAMLSGVEAHTDVVSRAIGQALALATPDLTAGRGGGGRALVLFCAEQGFAGAFSERVLDAAGPISSGDTLLLIGSRGAAIAEERGHILAWTSPMSTHAAAAPGLADRLAEALYARVVAGKIASVHLVFSRTASPGVVEVVNRPLLPLDYARFPAADPNRPPLFTLPPQVLLEGLTAEYVFAQLCEATLQAFAAENEARMLEMAQAKSNIDDKLTTLKSRERQLRQEEITTEIVELAAGAEAQRRPPP